MIGKRELDEKLSEINDLMVQALFDGRHPATAILQDNGIDEDEGCAFASKLNRHPAGSPGAHFLTGLAVGLMISRDQA